MSTKEIVKQEASLPAAYDYGEQTGTGFENTPEGDLSVPFLAILQSNSPQVENKDPEGSEPGMIFNTVTRELVSGEKGVVFTPCHYDVAYVEWIPRTKGGGFVAVHSPDSETVVAAIKANGGSKFGGLKVGENDLVETHYVYGLILDDQGRSSTSFAVIGFKSTGLKPWRAWRDSMRLLRKGQVPIFANRARIRSTKQKNSKGTFYNYQIEPLNNSNWLQSLIDPVGERDLLEETKGFRDLVLGGEAKIDYSRDEAVPETAPGDGDTPF